MITDIKFKKILSSVYHDSVRFLYSYNGTKTCYFNQCMNFQETSYGMLVILFILVNFKFYPQLWCLKLNIQ